jgi:hypothetical protein
MACLICTDCVNQFTHRAKHSWNGACRGFTRWPLCPTQMQCRGFCKRGPVTGRNEGIGFRQWTDAFCCAETPSGVVTGAGE